MLRMRIGSRVVVAVTAIFGLTSISISPATAATVWQDGVSASWPSVIQNEADHYVEGYWRSSCYPVGVAAIRLHGDYLWIRDRCADGHSTFADFKLDNGNTYICRNGRGAGTVVRCNFDWAERNGTFLVGVSEGRTVLHRDNGNSIFIPQ
jgi:hypothetical protein